jgi:hypothetical protein
MHFIRSDAGGKPLDGDYDIVTAQPAAGLLFGKVRGSRFKAKTKGRHELFMIYGWAKGL